MFTGRPAVNAMFVPFRKIPKPSLKLPTNVGHSSEPNTRLNVT